MIDLPRHLGDMDPESFRRHGHALIDWIADYLGHHDRYPVLSRVAPGSIASQLPARPPDEPEAMETIMQDFEQVLLPGITHWNHPGFMAYFGITGSAPGILGELLAAGLNVNAMLWRTSPSATELEQVTLDWLRQMLGLPAGFEGIITDSASISSLLAIAAAREALPLEIRRRGMSGRADLPRLRLYISDQTHSSVEKAAIALGIGQEGVRKIGVDGAFRMDAEALADAINQDLAEGWRPFCVVATVGTTSTTSIDPVPAIAAICREFGLWLHVDGAYGGTAAIVPEMRFVLDGVEQADSFVVNPHKWMFTPVDCSALYLRDPQILQRAFRLVPAYLQTSDEGVTNYMDWGVQLGRRFRALKLWLVIRTFGRKGIIERLREHIRLGRLVAQWVDEHPGFERTAPTPFSTVCFRARPRWLEDALVASDEQRRQAAEAYLERLNAAIIEAVNATGEIFIAATRLNGHYTLRMAIGHIGTDEAVVRRAWQLIQEAARNSDEELERAV
jgi:aromatic-L-amino-acid/L-tryptophan decarboxylase